jgi:hypothetical protein
LDVIEENTEIEPCVAVPADAPEPPPPTVTVIAEPEDTAKPDAVLNPPAPPPPPSSPPPPPPPATTKYSTAVGLLTALGVTLLDDPLAGPLPCVLVALTVNVYAVPFVSPVTVMGDDDPVPVKPPGLDVAV